MKSLFYILATFSFCNFVFAQSSIDILDSNKVFETETIKVEDKKNELSPTLPSNILSGKELTESSGLPLAEALKSITGVNSINTGSTISKPVIHGLSGNRILILNNGIRLEGQQWGFEHAPEIDPFVAKRVIVVKGANSVRYGADAIGGVILVEPGELSYSDDILAEFNMIGFTNGRAGVFSGNIGGNFSELENFSFNLQGTLKKAGNINTPSYTLKNTGFNEQSFSSSFGYNNFNNFISEIYISNYNSKVGIFSGSHIGNLTDLENAIKRNVPFDTGSFSYQIDRPFQDINHLLIKSESKFYFSNGNTINIDYAWQNNRRKEYDKDIPSDPTRVDLPELDFEITTNTIDLSFDHRISKRFEGTIGITGIRQTNVGRGRVFIPNFENYSGGLYFIERFLSGKTEFEAGVRYDYKWERIYKYENNVIISPSFSYNSFSASTGILHRFNLNNSVSLNFGTAWRPPSVNELFSDGLHHGSAAIEIGDRNLTPERSYNIIGSYDFNFFKKLSGNLTAYYNYISDYIYLAPVPPPTLTIRGAFPTYYYKQADAEFKGIDMDINYAISEGLSVGGRTSIVRAFNRTADDYLFLIPPDRFELSSSFSADEILFLTDPYLTVSFEHVSKQTRVPKETDYSPPPPGYNLVNFDIGSSIKIGSQNLNMILSVRNLFDTKYRDYLNRFRYFTDDIGRNIILRIILPLKIN